MFVRRVHLGLALASSRRGANEWLGIKHARINAPNDPDAMSTSRHSVKTGERRHSSEREPREASRIRPQDKLVLDRVRCKAFCSDAHLKFNLLQIKS